MKTLLRQLGLDAVYGIDFETYYDDHYSLRKMATTDYIADPRFELQLAAIQKHSWSAPKVLASAEFRRWATTIDWRKTGMLAHHCQFDALIASHHCGIEPAFYFDSLSMARPVMPIQVGGSLDVLARAFGLPGKTRRHALEAVKGKRFQAFARNELREFMRYAGDDIVQTWLIFHKLREYLPLTELKLIDLTIKMYAQPTLLVDKAMLDNVRDTSVASKAALIDQLKVDRGQLMSNEKFAALLRQAGVEPPMKISQRTGKPALALSKQDLEFKALLKHRHKHVRTLVQARMAVKSTLLETRADRMSGRTWLGAQPIYLSYWGAKSGRWAGSDSSNWQNLPRGSDLRKAIHAPAGHALIIADLAQIEARINAWFNGQHNLVEAFAARQDVYRLVASRIYNKPADKIDQAERFVGKVATLALGYGAGWARFADMLRVGAFGPPLDISDSRARDIHAAWRSVNPFIVAGWRRADSNARSAFLGKQRIVDGVLTYEGLGDRGFTHGPGGVGIRYDAPDADEEGMRYVNKYRRLKSGEIRIERQRLWGGLIVENNTQFLARQVIAHQMVEIAEALPYWRQAMTTHDEIVGVVPVRCANKALSAVQTIMARSPDWAPDLPLAVDAHISARYDK